MIKQLQGKTLVELHINGETRCVLACPSDLLLDVIRAQLGLTSPKPGCKNGDCGTCTILMDGWPVKSCLILAVEAEDHELLTVEGLHNTPIQAAFVESEAFQCGYCTSGFLMVSHALLQQHPDADEQTMEDWLQSNLCRCTSYEAIRQALKSLMKQKTEDNK